MVWPPPPLLLELSSHFFQNSLTRNLKNNFFTVFSLLAHWHLFAFDCFRAKKSDSKLLDPPRPPLLLEEYHKKHKFFVGWLPWQEQGGASLTASQCVLFPSQKLAHVLHFIVTFGLESWWDNFESGQHLGLKIWRPDFGEAIEKRRMANGVTVSHGEISSDLYRLSWVDIWTWIFSRLYLHKFLIQILKVYA